MRSFRRSLTAPRHRCDGSRVIPRDALANLVAPALALAPMVFRLVHAFAQHRRPEPGPAAVIWAERSPWLEETMVTGYVLLAGMIFAAPLLLRGGDRASRVFAACLALGATGALLR